MPGPRGPRPFGVGILAVTYAATLVGFVMALLVSDWVERPADDRIDPSTVDFATTDELEEALRYALSLLPREGSARESAADRNARQIIEEGLAGEVVVIEGPGGGGTTTTTSPRPLPPTTTTTTAPASTTTTTTVPTARPTLDELLDMVADGLASDLTGGPDVAP